MFSLRACHLLFGGKGLLIFLLSGQYMTHVAGAPELADAQRMVYRASHIYLLLACVANIVAGASMEPGASTGPFRQLCSLLLMAALVLLGWSFFAEAPSGELERPAGRIALYLLFGVGTAMLVYALSTSYSKRRSKD